MPYIRNYHTLETTTTEVLYHKQVMMERLKSSLLMDNYKK